MASPTSASDHNADATRRCQLEESLRALVDDVVFGKPVDVKHCPLLPNVHPVKVRPALRRIVIYETKTRFYLVGSNLSETRFQILKIDRTADAELVITEDDFVYTRQEITELLEMIDDGNRATGGLHKYVTAYGIVGFVRFLEGYYMVLITERSLVAMIGGHCIYQIDSTVLVPIPHITGKTERHQLEARYVEIFSKVDLSKNFYFSYTYDLTHTLQHNMTREEDSNQTGGSDQANTSDESLNSSVSGEQQPRRSRDAESTKDEAEPSRGRHAQGNASYNSMFAWNHYLLTHGFRSLRPDSPWILPVIHGFVKQAKMKVFSRPLCFTLIGRRSRYFAGARYLKRGVNDQGYVANEVETEQIVHDARTTSSKTRYLRPLSEYTSFVQMRGSIPVYWCQEASNITPKPPIRLNAVDPFYSAAALHFDSLFQRYGSPIIAFNLVKSKEKRKRESLLLDEFTQMVQYLNQFLPQNYRIQYIAWDMARTAKSSVHNVIEVLEDIVAEAVLKVGIFHSGPELYVNKQRAVSLQGGKPYQSGQQGRRQHGVLRTNCIDCLDRTNAAQLMAGKCAFGYQLYALGIIDDPHVEFDTDAVNLLTAIYHDLGDTIALQYGGSELVNTMETYRKINALASRSRDVINSFRRYYNNSFTDNNKQGAINLFLGNFTIGENEPMLWELNSDYHLHNEHPRTRKYPRSYMIWWTQQRSEKEKGRTASSSLPKSIESTGTGPDEKNSDAQSNNGNSAVYRKDNSKNDANNAGDDDQWFTEVYQPRFFSEVEKMFFYNMNSTQKNQIKETHRQYDYSPFNVRPSHSKSINILTIPKTSKPQATSPNEKPLNLDSLDTVDGNSLGGASKSTASIRSRPRITTVPFGTTIAFFPESATNNPDGVSAATSSSFNTAATSNSTPSDSSNTNLHQDDHSRFVSFSKYDPESLYSIKQAENAVKVQPAVTHTAPNPDSSRDNSIQPKAASALSQLSKGQQQSTAEESREEQLVSLAKRTLNPVTDGNELSLYQRYLAQMNEASSFLDQSTELPPVYSGFHLGQSVDEAFSNRNSAWQIYGRFTHSHQQAMLLPSHESLQTPLIEPRDIHLYQRFVDFPQSVAEASFTSSSNRVLASADKFDLYSSWLHAHNNKFPGFASSSAACTQSSVPPSPSNAQTPVRHRKKGSTLDQESSR